MGDDQIENASHDAGKNPEHHEAKADHADSRVKEFAIKTELALELDGQRKGENQSDPDRQQLAAHAADDPGDAGPANGADHQINQQDTDQGQTDPAGRERRQPVNPGR